MEREGGKLAGKREQEEGEGGNRRGKREQEEREKRRGKRGRVKGAK